MDQPGSLHAPRPSPAGRLFLARPFSCRACLYGGRLAGGGCKGGCSPEPEALLAPGDDEDGEAEGEEEAEGSPVPACPPAPRSPSPPTPPCSPPSAPCSRGREPSLPPVPPSPTLRRRAKSLPLPGERGLRPAVQQHHRPQSPSRRKTVRFADCLGLELTAVRHFCQSEEQETPMPPSLSAQELLKTRKPPALGDLEPVPFGPPALLLEPLFPPSPGSSAGFLDRLRAQKVALEWVRSEAGGLRGAVRVLNLAFQKEVSVRYSLDRWASALEIPASYQPHSLGPETDRFAFRLPISSAGTPTPTLDFALRYRLPGAEFWDNNRGENYRLRARTRASAREGEAPAPDANAWIHFI
ncbi:protein phosphatase 1 regulatory subunit 3E-like [Sceloporus undulatus]|uniref:protein phosphatase 1 regulatory subunit 3E-like n=1 Tax=Sceloporus undulatus TaxID=8520 RepID=UPI001C4AAAE9|nr:protein phosphatase 1 regulatory subunit 3E-like [Sceloporus undulatus]